MTRHCGWYVFQGRSARGPLCGDGSHACPLATSTYQSSPLPLTSRRTWFSALPRMLVATQV